MSANMDVSTSKGDARVQTLKSEYIWTIENYSLRTQNRHESLKSEKFKIEGTERYYSLMFFPTGISGDDDFAKLYLVQCKNDEVEVSFTVTFLVDDEPVKTEKSISRKFNQRVKEMGIQKVYRVQNVNELLSAEDVMTIRCELTVRVSEVKEIVPTVQIEKSVQCPPWHLDFSNLFLSEHLSDVELVAQTGPSVPGHMIRLAASSPVLGRMIESAEKRKNGQKVVYVNDIRREVLVDMMCFIYKRKIAWSGEDFIGDLLSAAHNYQVEELKQLCETMLSNHLTSKNVMEMYAKAKACNAEHLKAEALRFIRIRRPEII